MQHGSASVHRSLPRKSQDRDLLLSFFRSIANLTNYSNTLDDSLLLWQLPSLLTSPRLLRLIVAQ